MNGEMGEEVDNDWREEEEVEEEEEEGELFREERRRLFSFHSTHIFHS